jgi:hypothetical protein
MQSLLKEGMYQDDIQLRSHTPEFRAASERRRWGGAGIRCQGHSEVTLQKVQAVETKVVAKPSSSGPRKVTPQRKQNNRRAQQRYREKRKAQTTRLEQQVISLANELEALQVRHCTLNNCRRRGCELIFQSCNVLISMPTLVSQSATR